MEISKIAPLGLIAAVMIATFSSTPGMAKPIEHPIDYMGTHPVKMAVSSSSTLVVSPSPYSCDGTPFLIEVKLAGPALKKKSSAATSLACLPHTDLSGASPSHDVEDAPIRAGGENSYGFDGSISVLPGGIIQFGGTIVIAGTVRNLKTAAKTPVRMVDGKIPSFTQIIWEDGNADTLTVSVSPITNAQ